MVELLPIHYVSVGINTFNIAILLLLLSVFIRNYRHIKSRYTSGLLIFSLLLLAENIISLHLGIFSWPSYEPVIISHIVLINGIQLLALLSLLYVTWK